MLFPYRKSRSQTCLTWVPDLPLSRKRRSCKNRRLDLVTMPTLRTTCQGGQPDALLRADVLPLKSEQTLIGAAEMPIGHRCWMYMCSSYKGRASAYKGRASSYKGRASAYFLRAKGRCCALKATASSYKGRACALKATADLHIHK